MSRFSLDMVFGMLLLAILAIPAKASAAGMYSPGNIRQTVVAGQSITGEITVSNPAASLEQYAVEVNELTVDSQGNLGVRKPSSPTTFWGRSAIQISPSSGSIEGNSQATLSYTIAIPADAESADQLAAIVITTKHADFPTIYLAIPVWVAVTRADDPAGVSTIIPGSSLPAGTLSVVDSVATNLAELEPSFFSDMETIATSDQDIPDSPEATHEASSPNRTIAATGILLKQFGAKFLSVSTPRQQLTLQNIGRRVSDGTAQVKYETLNGQPLGTTDVREPLILPGTTRTRLVTAPTLFLQTSVGQLPYFGGLISRAQAAGANPAQAIEIHSYIVPWWLISLLLAALVSLVTKLLAYHPRAPHRPYVFRYQGRLSLAGLLTMLAVIQYASTSPFVSIVAAEGSDLQHVVTIEATIGYAVKSDATATVLSFQANQVIQVIAGGKVYLVDLSQPTLSLPPNTDILLVAPFS